MNRQKIIRYTYRMKNMLWNYIFPPRCILCDKITEQEDGQIHEECRKRLYPVQGPVCFRCGRPVSDEKYEYCYDCAQKEYGANIRNAQKRHGTGGSPYIQGKALFVYQGDIKQTMYRFKYANRREYGAFFAEYAYRRYGDWIREHRIEAIVPVPMYRKKQKRRGYNQAEVFAAELGARMELPVCRNLIRRVRDTVPQKELNDQMRINNLKNAFQIVQNEVEYRYILLVDDIYTTGSTAGAVAGVLQSAGVREVYLMNICIGKGF